MNRIHHVALVLAATLAAACSGATDGSGSPPTPRAHVDEEEPIEYAGGCTAAVCADLPVPAIACADGPTITVCEPAANGVCAINVECGTVTTPPACTPSDCGDAIPAIARVCPAGEESTAVCEKSGSKCEWEFECIGGQGSGSGSSGGGSGGGGSGGGTSDAGAPGWTDGSAGSGGGGIVGSPPTADAGPPEPFDAAAWADAIGL